jgi:hypothetical protein
MTRDLVPDHLDGETALVLADLLYALADEIMTRNDGAIRIHFSEIDQRHRTDLDPRQLPLPLTARPDDWPF